MWLHLRSHADLLSWQQCWLCSWVWPSLRVCWRHRWSSGAGWAEQYFSKRRRGSLMVPFWMLVEAEFIVQCVSEIFEPVSHSNSNNHNIDITLVKLTLHGCILCKALKGSSCCNTFSLLSIESLPRNRLIQWNSGDNFTCLKRPKRIIRRTQVPPQNRLTQSNYLWQALSVTL